MSKRFKEVTFASLVQNQIFYRENNKKACKVLSSTAQALEYIDMVPDKKGHVPKDSEGRPLLKLVGGIYFPMQSTEIVEVKTGKPELFKRKRKMGLLKKWERKPYETQEKSKHDTHDKVYKGAESGRFKGKESNITEVDREVKAQA